MCSARGYVSETELTLPPTCVSAKEMLISIRVHVGPYFEVPQLSQRGLGVRLRVRGRTDTPLAWKVLQET